MSSFQSIIKTGTWFALFSRITITAVLNDSIFLSSDHQVVMIWSKKLNTINIKVKVNVVLVFRTRGSLARRVEAVLRAGKNDLSERTNRTKNICWSTTWWVIIFSYYFLVRVIIFSGSFLVSLSFLVSFSKVFRYFRQYSIQPLIS